ncbi:UDP-N-acetylmuramoyl-tripeptide--D-alanyl-D-alanine ligase [Capillimicrobium parvum]|uniref:UDP-N-acetylmuramoyl-tripeptide--D-alanyl-D-alanine ligase n=1 Tax=Capillimicrobium parvum TaxID=2884022 RepID=A0A9E7BZW5_9ACTN|nr:UDP-N-acetylmuramoyl-tripeptide--D-alanyl-D-alanine ligase [Capillimicrobium parvum]UGS35746.1 UDP-N-acetylmuramoyl-tripeptide--D-alanyl-D-alanine ligase [Capillimicrobium parvum]
MRAWSPDRVARAAGGRLVAPAPVTTGPRRVVIDSREVTEGDLFVGLPGAALDGGAFAARALQAGAWGTLTTPAHAAETRGTTPGAVIAVDDPIAGLHRLATEWRRALEVQVIGITGSTGKTSTKDLLAGMLRPYRRTVATAQNLNTEIGVPLTILSAPADTEVLVLEMAMRGLGQIAELAAIAEPDVGVIVNIGPVHLELLGSITAIAAAKAELIAGLRGGGTAVVPVDEPLLEPYHRHDLSWITFGLGGDVADLGDVRIPFESAHMRRNALAALGATRAVGVEPRGLVDVELSARRGQRVELDNGAVILNDCYNANPMSMRAALDELHRAPGRRVAVLGDMLELGPDEIRFHEEIGAYARERSDVLVTVGPLAAHMGGDYSVADAAAAAALVEEIVSEGDTVLVKASRGVGLEAVAEAL